MRTYGCPYCGEYGLVLPAFGKLQKCQKCGPEAIVHRLAYVRERREERFAVKKGVTLSDGLTDFRCSECRSAFRNPDYNEQVYGTGDN